MRSLDEIAGTLKPEQPVYIFGKGASLNRFGGDFSSFAQSPCIAVNDAFLLNPHCQSAVFHHNFVITQQTLPFLLDRRRFILTVPKEVQVQEPVVDPAAFERFWEAGHHLCARFVPVGGADEDGVDTIGSDVFGSGVEPLIFSVTFLSAIRLAYLMGSRRTILVGFDFGFDASPYAGALPELTGHAAGHKRLYFAWHGAIYKQVSYAAKTMGITIERVGTDD